jgi:Zn-dependent M16 (insulinase) family peptidase
MHVLAITRKILHKFSTHTQASSPHFTLLSATPSPDLKATLLQYTHTPTNSRVYHFQNNDPENAFASVVKTYVLNDSGCPHILEHLACCGS